MKRRIALFALILVSFSNYGTSQWDQYFANWEGKPGSVILNMSWFDLAPVEELPIAVVSTLRFPAACRSDGFPEPSYHNILDSYSDEVVAAYTSIPGTEVIGHFIHDCEKRDYFYARDSLSIKELQESGLPVNEVFARPKVEIFFDPGWKIYLNFLYPDPYLKESMTNGRVINELAEEGVNLNKAIRIDHKAGFNSERQRDQFRLFILEQGFKINSLYRQGNIYLMDFSRKNPPNLKTMNEITLRLSFEAQSRGGMYRGWSVELED